MAPEGPWDSWKAPMPGSVLAEGDAPAMARPRKYPDELRERAVRLVFESKRPIAHVAQDLGIHKESLRKWVRQAEADSGRRRDLLSSEEREELKWLRKENFELRRANAILKDASVYSRRSSTRPGDGDPLHRDAAGCLRGRADLRGDRRAGEHALRAQVAGAVPPRALRPRAARGDRGGPERPPPRLRRPQDLEG